MAAQIVYDDVAEGADLGGQLFAGKKFWVAQRMPARKGLLEKIVSNGGEVTTLEKRADFLIADHFRKDCPAGSISYTFIQKSIDNGAIEDPNNHIAGPVTGTARPPGVASRPGKNTRAAYTAEEDRILYKWVRDHERMGGTASGNELYKQLEQQYPRHTWQSWRERYLRRLRDQPPVGLNVPDNAPPSPPSDQSTDQVSPKRPVSKIQGQDAKEADAQSGAEIKATRPAKLITTNVTKIENYTADDLEVLFQFDDWEELYANADTIVESSVDVYAAGWAGWAKFDEGGRTAEQWRQYFEKVVQPQFDKDPPTKRALIRKKVLERHDKDKAETAKVASIQPEEPATPKRKRELVGLSQRQSPFVEPLIVKAMEARQGSKKHMDAYKFWVQATMDAGAVDQSDLGRNNANLHKALWPRWRKLSIEVQAPYHALEAADRLRIEREARERREKAKIPPSPEAPSSSTMIQKTPDYVTKAFDREVKRFRGETGAPIEPSRPSKRPRREEILLNRGRDSHVQDIRKASVSELFSNDDREREHEREQDQQPRSEHHIIDDIIQTQLQAQHSDEDNLDEADQPTPTIELEDIRYPEIRLGSPLPFDTTSPTPRTRQNKVAAFDTQAILSSPSQGLSLNALPKPSTFGFEATLSSPAPELAALPCPRNHESLTPSVEEEPVTRSLSPSAYTSSPVRQFESAPLPLPLTRSRQDSPAFSETSSEGSVDPDPPLTPEELEDFFSEQAAQGFTDPEITAALKHTRCRPELAVRVLDSWKENKPVPNARGIWSGSDDEGVEGGHRDSLARLEKKHTFDGWGGITERMRFLEQLRQKMQGN